MNSVSNPDARLQFFRICDPNELSQLQVRVIFAEQHGFDTLVTPGTRSGKTLVTLPMALIILLDDPADHRIMITILPLKCCCCKVTQESDFNQRYGIPTVVINDDSDT